MANFNDRFPNLASSLNSKTEKTKREKRKARKIKKLRDKSSFAKKTGNIRKSLRLNRRIARKGGVL